MTLLEIMSFAMKTLLNMILGVFFGIFFIYLCLVLLCYKTCCFIN